MRNLPAHGGDGVSCWSSAFVIAACQRRGPDSRQIACPSLVSVVPWRSQSAGDGSTTSALQQFQLRPPGHLARTSAPLGVDGIR